MKILYIAPLPPPITGHAIAAQVLLEHLQSRHLVQVVNLSEGSRHDGSLSLNRILMVLRILWKVMNCVRRADRVYLTISESVAGNLKDILIYALVGKSIGATVIHLHGGSFGKLILGRSHFLRKLNRFYLSKVGGAVVSGPSHLSIFGDCISVEKIYTIPNFAQEFMFVSLEQVERKFCFNEGVLRVLYVGGMTVGKGYLRLLEAYEALSNASKHRIQIDFAGKFDNEIERRVFSDRISAQQKLTYHGVVGDETKAKLFAEAHVFCLPTSFLEGQPISIIEAYASGCVVMSTPRPGVLDIFDPSKNGFLISSDDSSLLIEALEFKCLDLLSLLGIAKQNRQTAGLQFRKVVFCERVESVLYAVN